MNVVAKFEKVSFNQFLEDYKKIFTEYNYDDPNTIKKVKKTYDDIKLPKRSTKNSAGYDFVSTQDFAINHGETALIPTGIRCKMSEDWVLMAFVRSSLGFKYNARLSNVTGIIDADYFFADNEGHIMIKLLNSGNKQLVIKEGDKICQGIFVQYGITEDDDVDTVRTGGIGSTGK